jgi:hypothetical protein
MTRAEIVAQQIRDTLAKAAKDREFAAAALRIEVTNILRTNEGYLIGVAITDNRKQTEEYLITIQSVG